MFGAKRQLLYSEDWVYPNSATGLIESRMLKYIAFVSLCAGVAVAADFMTGQAARAVIGQANFTAQNTLTATDTTVAGTAHRNYTGASKTVFGALGGIAYTSNRLLVTEATRIGLQPSLDRVLIFNNLSGTLPTVNQELPPFIGRCPVCLTAATFALGDVDANGNPTVLNQTDAAGKLVFPAVTKTGFRQPTAVASDGVRLAIADTSNNRVLLWNSIPNSDRVPADLVLGQADFVTVAPVSITASSMRAPQGVWLQNGKLYVADTGNNRVLIWNPIPTGNNQAANLVLGQTDFTSVIPVNPSTLNLVATNNTMLSPTAVTADSQNRVLVTDLGYSRVLIWNRIITTNQQAADVVIGQKDFTTTIPNDSSNLCKSSLTDTVVNTSGTAVTWVSGSTFPSSLAGTVVVINGTAYLVASWTSATSITLTASASTQTNVAITSFPGRCATTLDFPRFALSTGTSLFIADTGNNRVLYYRNVPTTNTTPPAADIVLGQVDEFADQVSSTNSLVTSAADSTPTPTSLAWDAVNKNLYVADPTDYRVLVFSPAEPRIPISGVVNAASRAVFASGFVSVGGTIRVQDTATITISDGKGGAAVDYKYAVKTDDTLELIAKGLAAAITSANSNKGDPNVFAYEEAGLATIRLFARKPGVDGNSVTLATSVGTNNLVSLASNGSSLSGGASAAQVAPGTLVLIRGTSLAAGATQSVRLNQQLPYELGGVQVYFDGMRAPLFKVSPGELGAQVPFPVFGSNSVSAWVRTNGVASNPIGIPVLNQNPGIFACDPTTYYNNPNGNPNDPQCDVAGPEPRAAIALHASDFASATVSVDGGIQGGDTATITIAGVPYSYGIQTGDTLEAVRDGLIAAINGDPNAPVFAAPTGAFTRIRLTAKSPGVRGVGYSVATSSTIIGGSAGGQVSLMATHNQTCCFAIGGANTPITPSNPAIPGETIKIYAAGLGLVAPEAARLALQEGSPYQGPPNSPRADVGANAGTGGAVVISASMLSGAVGVYEIVLELSNALNPNNQGQVTISQSFFTSNIVTIPVQPPTAVRFTITPDNTTVSVNTAINVTIAAFDQYGNPALNYTGTIRFGSTDSAAILPADPTISGGAGIFPVTFKTAGSQNLTVTDQSTFITGTSPAITVN